mgnify:CR=1 FL=1
MAISRSFGVCAQLRRHARLAREDAINAENSDEEKRPAKITLEGLRDLVALGLGAPNLGTFKGVDKDTGAMKFELDENRFITKDGKEYGSFDNSKGTYFESGEVDEDADFMGKLGSFFGGGNKK